MLRLANSGPSPMVAARSQPVPEEWAPTEPDCRHWFFHGPFSAPVLRCGAPRACRAGWIAESTEASGFYRVEPVLEPLRSLVLFGKGHYVNTRFLAGQRPVEDSHVLNSDGDAPGAAVPGILHGLARALIGRDPLALPLVTIRNLHGAG